VTHWPRDRSDAGTDVAVVQPAMQVRRLTPVDCERLQGFPDNYTNIPWRKKDESPDGPRYKALGNSWAVPVVRWIGKRIQEQINAA
jgi:DNA (cytosine-5)-methyltransferase 1